MSSDQRFQSISSDVAGRVAIYAMLSSNAYHKKKRVRFEVEKMGWIQMDLDGNPTSKPTKEYHASGLAYDIFVRQDSEDVVFAFRGTDSKRDYLCANLAFPPLNFQYRRARRVFRKFLEANKRKNIVTTGHSLGGGLALSMSVRFGVPAITFDPSPRIFDGIGDHHEPALREIIYEDGEILQIFRRIWKKIPEIVPKENVYRCSFDFAGSQHRSDHLAMGLLRLGSEINPELKPVWDAIPIKKRL